jgi:dTDP-4-dehydrorhamnose 3,5-epimerase
MKIQPLSISGAWTAQSIIHNDERGSFLEWFKQSTLLSVTGEMFMPVQANISVSNAGVIRGIHYSLAPRGQAKLVTVLRGSIMDVAIDVRTGSPTFGQHESVVLNAGDGKSVFLGSNLAHAFQALEENTIVSYLVSSEYSPQEEKEISPTCPTLNIKWTSEIRPILSEKDHNAPTLSQQISEELLPSYFG